MSQIQNDIKTYLQERFDSLADHVFIDRVDLLPDAERVLVVRIASGPSVEDDNLFITHEDQLEIELNGKGITGSEFDTLQQGVIGKIDGDESLGGIVEWARFSNEYENQDIQRSSESIRNKTIVYNIRYKESDSIPIAGQTSDDFSLGILLPEFSEFDGEVSNVA